MKLIDSQDRRSAILTDGHAFVWASAGTGKTHTLTMRALYLLLREGVPDLYRDQSRSSRSAEARRVVRAVVMTTFTRKAAAEMQSRLYGYLDLLVSSRDREEIADSDQARMDPLLLELIDSILDQISGRSWLQLRLGAEALAERASELQISTLHALAAGLLRRHPLESGIPPGVHFAQEDEDDLRGFEESLIERWWATEAGKPPVRDWLTGLLDLLSIRDISAWLCEVIRKPWLVEEMEGEFSEETGEQELLLLLERLSTLLAGGPGKKMRRLGDQIVVETGSQGEGRWSRLAGFFFEHRDYLFLDGKQRPKSLQSLLRDQDPSFLRWFEAFGPLHHALVGLSLRTEFADSWRTWLRLIRSFSEWALQAPVKELKLLTFDEMISRAARLLEQVPEVRREERNRVSALLVDEFQDTDAEQLRLIRALLRRTGPRDPEVLGFFVGDLKQSIYRFRGADIESVREFAESYQEKVGCRQGAQVFRLRTSFRSRPEITDFVNALFGDDYLKLAQSEEFLEPVKEESDFRPLWLEVETGETAGFKAEEGRQAASGVVVDSVRRLVVEEGYAFGEILVLSRDNRELDILVPALQQAGIPTIAGGARTFYRHLEVLDLLNLLISMLNPLDTTASAAVLRSPLMGASDLEIQQLQDSPGLSRLLSQEQTPPESISPQLSEKIDQWKELASRARGSSLADWLCQVETFLAPERYVDPLDREGRAVARVRKLMRSFGDICSAGVTPPLVWLLRQRERCVGVDRRDVELGEDVVLSDESVDAVRVMTAHKAKGLERRIVLVCDWGRMILPMKGSGNRVLASRLNGREIRGFELCWGPLRLRSLGFRQAREAEDQLDVEESIRLAYVAATRGAERLCIIHPRLERRELPPEMVRFIEGEGRLCITRTVGPPPETAPIADRAPAECLDPAAYNSLWQEREEACRQRLKTLYRPSEGAMLSSRTERETGGSDEQPRWIGTLVHRYLEEALHLMSFDETRLRALAHELVPGEEEVLQTSRRILERFFSAEEQSGGRESYLELVRESRILGREVPVLLHHEGKSWSGVLDLVLEWNDTILGIDYKTAAAAEDEALFALQSEIYRTALQRVFPERDCRFEFWWLRP